MPIDEVTPEEANRILKEQADKAAAGEDRPDRVTREEAQRIINKEAK